MLDAATEDLSPAKKSVEYADSGPRLFDFSKMRRHTEALAFVSPSAPADGEDEEGPNDLLVAVVGDAWGARLGALLQAYPIGGRSGGRANAQRQFFAAQVSGERSDIALPARADASRVCHCEMGPLCVEFDEDWSCEHGLRWRHPWRRRSWQREEIYPKGAKQLLVMCRGLCRAAPASSDGFQGLPRSCRPSCFISADLVQIRPIPAGSAMLFAKCS